MRLFIKKTILFGFCIVAIFTLLVFIIPINPDAYLCAYKNKCRLLESTPSPRIIFVGGSNLAFGLDSKRIKDSLHVNVVNTGLQADIGLKFMVDDISLYARKGDIVVLAPEYDIFYGDMMAGVPVSISEIMFITNFKKAGMLNTAQWINVISGIPAELICRIEQQKAGPRAYRASNFNEFGDEVHHWHMPSIPVAKPTPPQEKFNVAMGRYIIGRLKELQKRCKVIVIPTAYRQTAFDIWGKQVKEVAAFLDKEGFPFAISPQECVFPDGQAFDSDFHMDKQGVDRRTTMIIKCLQKYTFE